MNESATPTAPPETPTQGSSTSAPDGGRRQAPPRGDRERLRPLVELTLVRFREFTREPEAVFWVFVFPMLLAFALGIAFRNQPPTRPRVAVEADGTAAPFVARALTASEAVDAELLSAEDGATALRHGRVDLVVRVEAPGEGLAGAKFAYEYDPTRPESRTARLVTSDALERAAGRTDVTAARDEVVSEPGARYIDWLIPGLVGMNLMGSGMWGLGFSIVTARTRKLLKRFAATPMRRSHYLLSFMLSRLTFLILEVVAVLGFAWLVFGVEVHGSLAALFVVSLVGSLTFAGIGLLVAARPRTIEGVSGLMNFVMLPMWLLSGTFFSSERFPATLQPIIKVLPLTALNDALRAVINDGTSLAGAWASLAVLAAWCGVSFVVALRIFRWQ